MTCQRFFTCLAYDFLLPARTHVYVCTIPQTATQLARKDIKLSPRTGASQMNCLGERKGAGSSRSASTNEVSASKKIKLRERGGEREIRKTTTESGKFRAPLFKAAAKLKINSAHFPLPYLPSPFQHHTLNVSHK